MSSQAHAFFYRCLVLCCYFRFVCILFILFRGAVLNVQILLSTVNVNKYNDFKWLLFFLFRFKNIDKWRAT